METSVNNKCKAFTSIEQSRKLAKILPSESADMVYQSIEDEYGDGEWESIPRNHSLNIGYDNDVPCWSLAALISVLPKGTNINTLKLINKFSYCCWNYYDEFYADNPVDACYEMIIRLHEQNLL